MLWVKKGDNWLDSFVVSTSLEWFFGKNQIQKNVIGYLVK